MERLIQPKLKFFVTRVYINTGFSGDAFERIVDKAVHDARGLWRNTGVGMYLLQHFVDVIEYDSGNGKNSIVNWDVVT